MKTIFLFLTLLFSCSGFAAGIDDGDSITTSEPKESKLKHEEEVLKRDERSIEKKTNCQSASGACRSLPIWTIWLLM